MDYHAYIASPEWFRLRNRKVKSVGFRCEWCRQVKNLNVHHLHYRTLGHEDLDDLQVLCRQCHKHHHENGHLPEETKGFYERGESAAAKIDRHDRAMQAWRRETS